MSPGYGFAAIVAFVGRLHPLGVFLASLLMSLLSSVASLRIGPSLPSAVTGSGDVAVFLLAADVP
jgi:simple sugar transport system permease protein